MYHYPDGFDLRQESILISQCETAKFAKEIRDDTRHRM
jgi:hypothetical protein